ncbi:TPA: DUF551 domain-containing protein [Serratia marcescens]
MTLTTERQQFAEQNEMSMDFVNWFFDEKKDGCGNAWFIMAAAMWEGWKGQANREAQPVEEWREIDDTDGAYSVSSMGRIISNRTGKYLSVNSLGGSGYVKVCFNIGGTRTQTYMHRVVAKQFIDRPEGADEVNHINGVKTDNRACNLEWVTRSENVNHGYYHLGNNVNPIIAEPCEGSGPSLKFKSVCAAADYGFHSSHIYACLRGEFSQHKGYVWKSESSIAAPPAPAVPSELLDAMEGVIRISDRDHEAWARAKAAITACRAAMLDQPVSSGYTFNSPEIPDGWIACSEQMPDNDETKPIAIYTGKCLGQGMFVATYDEDGFFDYWDGGEIIGVTHWMPLPAAPEGGN